VGKILTDTSILLASGAVTITIFAMTLWQPFTTYREPRIRVQVTWIVPLRNDVVREELCLLAGIEDDGKADCLIKARRMGISCGLILPLLVQHKFVGVVLLLITGVGATAGVFGACRSDHAGRELPESVNPPWLDRHENDASNHGWAPPCEVIDDE